MVRQFLLQGAKDYLNLYVPHKKFPFWLLVRKYKKSNKTI